MKKNGSGASLNLHLYVRSQGDTVLVPICRYQEVLPIERLCLALRVKEPRIRCLYKSRSCLDKRNRSGVLDLVPYILCPKESNTEKRQVFGAHWKLVPKLNVLKSIFLNDLSPSANSFLLFFDKWASLTHTLELCYMWVKNLATYLYAQHYICIHIYIVCISRLRISIYWIKIPFVDTQIFHTDTKPQFLLYNMPKRTNVQVFFTHFENIICLLDANYEINHMNHSVLI